MRRWSLEPPPGSAQVLFLTLGSCSENLMCCWEFELGSMGCKADRFLTLSTVSPVSSLIYQWKNANLCSFYITFVREATVAPNEQQKAEIINKLRIEETRNHLLPLILSLWLPRIKEHFCGWQREPYLADSGLTLCLHLGSLLEVLALPYMVSGI